MTDTRTLVKDCLQGRPSAQAELYDLFAGQMLGVCYRYTKSVADAEDVLQEGFINVFRHLGAFRHEGELGAWVRRIMVHTALNYLKKHRRYQQELVFDDESLHPVAVDNPEVTLSAKELSDLIRQLPTGYQTIFNMHAVEGYSHVDIGRMLGIHEGTSRSQYARARALLVSWLKQASDHHKPEKYAR
jgi:RNA polymerase sigma factor (sigma-70 family)